MPVQFKVEFLGDRLDDRYPEEFFQDKFHEEEWNHFVREINIAIRDAQSYLHFSPWFIFCLVVVAILVVCLDIALNSGVFGNPQVGTIVLCTFVAIGILVICYLGMCRPTRFCEEQVEIICEDYSDEERDIYFFYRRHAHVPITQNRFYIEVFVGGINKELPLSPAEDDGVKWEDEPDVEIPDEPTSTDLVPFGTENHALVVHGQDPSGHHENQDLMALIPSVPGQEQEGDTDFLSLVPTGGGGVTTTETVTTLTTTTETTTTVVALKGPEAQEETAMVPLGDVIGELEMALVPMGGSKESK